MGEGEGCWPGACLKSAAEFDRAKQANIIHKTACVNNHNFHTSSIPREGLKDMEGL